MITETGNALAIRLKRYYPPDEYASWEDWIIAIEKKVIANLECPAAKHHRLRKLRARKIIGFDEFGYAYGDEELESDTCTVCGFDFMENK